MSSVIVNIGSVGLDTTRTPFKKVEDIMGGSGTFFGIASSYFSETGLVGIVGEDYPPEYLKILGDHMDLRGLVIEKGTTFRFDSSFGYDMGKRKTNKTELNVFGEWEPKVPEEYRDAEYLYLGNVGPEQQLRVMDQMNDPKLTVADTIEYWIENQKDALIEVISRVSGMVLNDEELRQLCETSNIITGARIIMDWGAAFVIIKKGEHGAVLLTRDRIFPTCGYPLEEIMDPTGAGDSFAGGLMGHIARTGKTDYKTMKEAIIYGNIMGSFAIQRFGIERYLTLTMEEIEDRYDKYKEMVTF